jgi:ParB-like chromosome segregation protein Spo0J
MTPTGEIVDGKNRWRACLMAGVEPKTFVLESDPWAYAIAKNEHRRHMSEEDRRAVRAKLAARAAEMATDTEGGDRRSEKITGEAAPVISNAEAAKANLVTVDDVKSIKAIEKHAPEELPAVMAAKKPLRATADKARSRAASIRRDIKAFNPLKAHKATRPKTRSPTSLAP